MLSSTVFLLMLVQHSKGFSCPNTIFVTEIIAPAAGWKTGPVRVQHKFERFSVYNGKEGEEEFELAPDLTEHLGLSVTQIWLFKGYRTMNLFMRCRYAGTQSVVWADIPTGVDKCSLSFGSGAAAMNCTAIAQQ